MTGEFEPHFENGPEEKTGPVDDILDLLELRFQRAYDASKAIEDDFIDGVETHVPEGAFIGRVDESDRGGGILDHIVLKPVEESSVTDSEIVSRQVFSTTFNAKFHIFRPVVPHPSTREDNTIQGYRPRAFVIYLESQRIGEADACFIVDSGGISPFDFSDRDIELSTATIFSALEQLWEDEDDEEANEEQRDVTEEEIDDDVFAEQLLNDLRKMPFHPFRGKAA